jgi:hypothetical protein
LPFLVGLVGKSFMRAEMCAMFSITTTYVPHIEGKAANTL